ncbi:MAG: DNA polymerase bacteriophage-type [Syntrophaceae bacterium]|nr:MAG: DNA polymerase bacteriophage-type [Syntrophaceae bacterium]
MTESLSPSSSDQIRKELLSLVKSVKGQVLNSKNLYVELDWKKPLPAQKNNKAVTDNSIEPLHDLGREVLGCQRCSLARTRKNIVFGDGNVSAKIVFVGEAPGADEDEQGLPFVGRAGQLLTNIIKAMGLARKDVYICNILKCRPPGNRNPLPDEIRLCEPFLKQQLQLISPQVICALGSFAAKTLLKTETPITALRGRFQTYEGIKLMPTYHPAYLLRNPSAKKQVWEDVQLIMKEIEL